MSAGYQEQFRLSGVPYGSSENVGHHFPDGGAGAGDGSKDGFQLDDILEVETLIGNDVLLHTGSRAGFFLCHLRDR